MAETEVQESKMRILGFSRKDLMNYLTNTPKLEEDEFTTFRVPRKDADWEEKELVQVVLHPRSPERNILGTARIIHKEPKFFFFMPHGLFEGRVINDGDAKRDGFPSSHEMYVVMVKMHGEEAMEGQINKLTLTWVKKFTHKERTGKPLGGRHNKM